MDSAANDADQSLRAESHGPAGAPVPHEEHGSVPVRRWPERAGRHEQAGHDQLVSRSRRYIRRTRVVFAFLGCLTACIDASSISVEEEREMGLAVAEEATREMSLLQDEPVARFV